VLKEITKETAKIFLKNNFPQYKITSDPFEKYLGYYENELLGIITFSIIYERAEINYICVKENMQGKNIGSNLLEKAVEIIKKSNCKIISLEVREDNQRAINLYKKYNFNIETIRKKYYGGKDGILLIRKLGD
jgi:ribosomal-protein-alanine N-acetyltransferase